jgi:hypothetical protein
MNREILAFYRHQLVAQFVSSPILVSQPMFPGPRDLGQKIKIKIKTFSAL